MKTKTRSTFDNRIYFIDDDYRKHIQEMQSVGAELLAIVKMVAEFFDNNMPISRGALLSYGDNETATIGLAVRQAIRRASEGGAR